VKIQRGAVNRGPESTANKGGWDEFSSEEKLKKDMMTVRKRLL